MSDEFYDETPLGNTYAEKLVSDLIKQGTPVLDDLYDPLTEVECDDIGVCATIVAASFIVAHALKDDDSEEDIPSRLQNWIEDEDFTPEEYVEDAARALKVVSDSELEFFWEDEGDELIESWKQHLQDISNELNQWLKNPRTVKSPKRDEEEEEDDRDAEDENPGADLFL